MLRRALAIVAVFLFVPGWALPTQREDRNPTCLMVAARNIAQGNSNFYLYLTISNQRVAIVKGDVLEYDVYLSKGNPEPKGGIDAVMGGGPALRDSGAKDQLGHRSHGDGDLSAASGRWFHRRIGLDPVAGRTANQWDVQFESDKPGLFVQFLRNLVVRHATGSETAIYLGGPPPMKVVQGHEGYSQVVVVRPVPVSLIADGADLTAFIRDTMGNELILMKLDAFRGELAAAARIAKAAGQDDLLRKASEATSASDQLWRRGGALTASDVDSFIASHSAALKGPYPRLKSFRADLVGHAHIDFQWLWNWPETVQVCRGTFLQAVKFLVEYPEFRFSQSSSALYQAVEQADPKLFAQIKREVKAGRWEIVGGRVTEADTNIISPESHARQFLYGQAYFQERFGKRATVGWEPDTFGHALQMPQILRLAGIDAYYFGRAGVGYPLFWWQAPDGSRVLAWDDAANGSWYSADIQQGLFDKLFAFEKKTSQKEMLWVYGVGNHGGGPTRENIETARSWQQKSYLPTVEFSTARAFFDGVSKGALGGLPVHKSDLNTVFEGCYTSHSDVKRWNRDAEAATESAEALAALAAQFGFAYPHRQFRRNWEDILWNHHHDTIDGTCVGSSYKESEKRFTRAIASSRGIALAAAQSLAGQVRLPGKGVLVANPFGYARTALVVCANPGPAYDAAGGARLQTLRSQNGQVAFMASVPPVGYQAIAFAKRTPKGESPIYSPVNHTLENSRYRVVLDPNRGVVTSVFDKLAKREAIAVGGSGNRLEIHWEKDGGGSSWGIDRIDRIEPLAGPVSVEIVENGPVVAMLRWTRRFQSTDLVQTLTMDANGPPAFGLQTQWNERGGGGRPAPFLKVAFDVAATKPVQTYDVPFGTIQRPCDNREYPALQWVDLGDAVQGAALINDCKHGYSAQGNTLRMSLIRSTVDPDPNPNMRPQSARWEFLPRTGSSKRSGVLAEAQAFNHPAYVAPVASNLRGMLPPRASLVKLRQPGLVVTGVKLAEVDDDLVVRFYEAFGLASTSALQTLRPATRTFTVNLLEDVLQREQSTSVQVRPYEIRTLKMKIAKRK